MPVILQQAPPASLTSLNEVLPGLLGASSLTAHTPKLQRGLTAAMPGQKVEAPLSAPVYVVGLKDVLEIHDLSRAKPAFWAHVISKRSDAVVTAQTDGATSQFQALYEGAPAFWREFDHLQSLHEVARADYELAEIRVPALHVEGFLLKSKSGGDDIVVPFRSYEDAVKVGQDYKLADFLTSLRPAAKRVLSMDNEDTIGG